MCVSRALALPLRFAPGHLCWEGAEVRALMWVAQSLLPEDSRLTSELLASQRLFLGLCLLAFLPCALPVRLDQAGASAVGWSCSPGEGAVGASPTPGLAWGLARVKPMPQASQRDLGWKRKTLGAEILPWRQEIRGRRLKSPRGMVLPPDQQSPQEPPCCRCRQGPCPGAPLAHISLSVIFHS